MTMLIAGTAVGSERNVARGHAWVQLCARMVLVFLAYLAGAGVGKSLGKIPDVEIFYWPPAGVMLGTLLLSRRRQWGWFLAAGLVADLIANRLLFGNSLQLALVYFAANALESLTAASLIRRFVVPFRLDSMRDITLFMLLGAGASPLVGATIIGVVDEIVGKHDFWTTFGLVWLGDGSGLLVTTPLVYVTAREWRRTRIGSRERLVEGIVLSVVLVAVSIACFADLLATMYFTLPVLLWASARFQLKGGVAALLAVTLICAGFALAEVGKFNVQSAQLRERIVLAQVFLGVSAISTLLVGVLSQRYLEAMASLQATNSELEVRVAERTAKLARSEAELLAHRERLEQLVAERTRELEESLKRLSVSERMAALGTLSAGVGHDMANILVPMRMSLGNIERSELSPACREDVQVVARSSDYLKSLAMGLRLLSLDPEGDSRDGNVNLGTWWPEAATIFRAILPRGIEVHARGMQGAPEVAIPAHALTQAVFNLVQNAGDAMRERGHGNVWVECDREDRHVVLSVRDDGPGMSEEVRARCMEAFFTTKGPGRGTGLGLAIVHRVLQRFGVAIELDTAPGAGAAFRLLIPIAAESRALGAVAIIRVGDARVRAIAAAIVTNKGSYVIEDEPEDGAQAVLVLDANAAEEAVAAFLGNGDKRAVVRLGGPRLGCDGDARVFHVAEVRVGEVRDAICSALDCLDRGR